MPDTTWQIRVPWLNPHPAAKPVLDAIQGQASLEFLEYPRRYGLLLAPDKESFILRVGVLRGAGLITWEEAANLVRGLGVTVLNSDEAEGHGQ